MQDQDSVDPGDAALQQLLVTIAERARDPAKKEAILDFLISMRPLSEWAAQELDVLTQTCVYITSLARLNRELEQLNGTGARPHSPDRSSDH